MKSAALILIDKPQGRTSAQIVARVKRMTGANKVGHAGTLDPMATGLLVCLLNGATRLADHAMHGDKEYTGSIKFGVTTDTDDVEGSVLTTSDRRPKKEDILKAIKSLTGTIQQTPPSYSAVKINGQRAYALARKGETPEIKSREVTVYCFEITDFEGEDQVEQVTFKIQCTKGTYIRSLARDLGQMLGCGGTLSSLRRTASAPFTVERAQSLEAEELCSEPLKELLPKAQTIVLPQERYERVMHGDLRSMQLPECREPQGEPYPLYFYASEDQPDVIGGVLSYADQVWKIVVNFKEKE